MKKLISQLMIMGLFHTSVIFAHTGASGIIKERMESMKVLSAESKAVSKILKGKTPYSEEVVKTAADNFVFHAEAMRTHFPDTVESREGNLTEALSSIWLKNTEFNKQVERFVSRANAFRDSAYSTSDLDALSESYIEVAKECRSCHKVYRKPK